MREGIRSKQSQRVGGVEEEDAQQGGKHTPEQLSRLSPVDFTALHRSSISKDFKLGNFKKHTLAWGSTVTQ